MTAGILSRIASSDRQRAFAGAPLLIMNLLSPLAALFLERSIASTLGVGSNGDGYRVGTLVFFFGIQVYNVHVLPNVLIPLYARTATKNSVERATAALLVVGSFWTLPALGLAVIGTAKPYWLAALVAPGVDPHALAFGADLVPALAISLFLASITGVLSCGLKFHGSYATFALSQLSVNVALLVGLTVSKDVPTARWLGQFAIAGSCMSLSFAAFLAARAIPFGKAFKTVEVRESLRQLRASSAVLPYIIFTQAVTVAIYRALSALPTGSVASWGFAWRLVQIATILPLTYVTLTFPKLAMEEAQQSAASNETALRAFRKLLLTSAFCGGVLALLSQVVVLHLLGAGRLGQEGVSRVSSLLRVLAVGAPLHVLLPYLTKVSLARKGWNAAIQAQGFFAVGSFCALGVAAKLWGPLGIAWTINILLFASVLIIGRFATNSPSARESRLWRAALPTVFAYPTGILAAEALFRSPRGPWLAARVIVYMIVFAGIHVLSSQPLRPSSSS